MNLKIRILSIILALLACLTLASCNGKKDDDDDTPGDDFTGDISKDDEDDDKQDDPATEDEGDPDKVTTITTASQLREMKRKGTYILGADIDLGGEAWTPVGTYGAPFEGTFDGAGYKITGLKINTAKADRGESLSYQYLYYGLFGVAKGATIKNVTFENASVSANTTEVFTTVYAGVIAGISIDSKISDCTVSGSVNAVSSNSIAVAGGLIGVADNSVLTSCSSKASVKTENSPVRAVSGGLLGYSRLGTKLDKCFSKASVTASSTIGLAYSGGIAGSCSKTEMTLCFSDSEIYAEVTSAKPQSGAKGAAHAGGISAVAAAMSDKNMSVFTKCYSTDAKISAYSVENAVYVSGLVTETEYTKFIDCYSYARLEGKSVNASASGAGLFGSIDKTCTVEHSFFAGSIKLDSPENTAGTLSYVSLSNEDGEKVYLSAYYKLDTVFTLNGTDYNKGDTKAILIQGELRQAIVFSSLSMLCDTLSWNPSEWTMQNEMVYPIIPALYE